MILVTGATGNIGSHLCRRLASEGHAVRALVRDAAKAEPLKRLGVTLEVGDFDDAAALERSVRGVERAFILVPPSPALVEQERRLLDAARKGGVRHVVKLSGLGVRIDHEASVERWHAESERAIQESGVAYTFLRPNYFMQNVRMFAPTIARDGAIYASLGETRLSMIDVQDIAAVAARVLTETGHEGRTYDLTGPELLTMTDVANHLGRALGKPVRYVDVPDAAVHGSILQAGLPAWLADMLVHLSASYRSGVGSEVLDTVERIGKTKPRTFADFAAEAAIEMGAPPPAAGGRAAHDAVVGG